MKKFFALFLTILLILTMSACGVAESNSEMNYDMSSPPSGISGSSSPSKGGAAGAPAEGGTYGDAATDGGVSKGDHASGGAEYDMPAADADDYLVYEEAEEAAPDASFDMADADFDMEGDFTVKDDSGSKPPMAGLLTAGEWKDLDDIEFWTKLLNRNDWYKFMEERALFPNNINVVYVRDRDGAPCFNAKVELLGENGEVIYTARTDVSGHAYLFHSLTNNSELPVKVRVGAEEIALASDGVTSLTLASQGAEIKKLDLMFMIDTTGSMMDELRYLQAELEDVVLKVSEASGNTVSINVSVNFYRDRGDEYVVLPFEFTEDLEKVMSTLRAQSANGGGDYPEAVHTALKNAVGEHQWRGDAVKLMFLVLDAPPHAETEIQGINAELRETVIRAAQEGIRIIPVASSGVDTHTEFLMRSYAAMTGGTYVFLTNHSGIGGDHLEPTIGQYEVEALNACLVRVIGEYCGLATPKSNNQNTVGYGTKIDFNASVAWANWSGDVKKISALALNADKLYVDGADRFPIYKCESVSELDYFKSFYADTFSMDGTWDEIGSFNDITCGFNDEFFKKNTLLLVYVDSNSCTPRFDVDSVVIINGDSLCVNIVQTNDPGDWDDAMCGWLIAVSVSREDIRGITVYNAVQK